MERVVDFGDERSGVFVGLAMADACAHGASLREEIVRCRDCKHLNTPEWDNTLAMLYGEPPLTCDLLSMNEWRMDGNRRVADTTFLEVEPDGFCSWGERRDA